MVKRGAGWLTVGEEKEKTFYLSFQILSEMSSPHDSSKRGLAISANVVDIISERLLHPTDKIIKSVNL